MRSLDDGKTWSAPYRVNASSVGHQFFPDADALDGRLVVVWQDSRVDPAYSVQRPIGNTSAATSSGTAVVNTYAAVSTNGTTFGATKKVSSVGMQPQYEMFGGADVPFVGDYNWIQLVQRTDGSLFGYMTWTDNRDVVPGTDPREATQDGFDVDSGWQLRRRRLDPPVQPGRVRPEHLREHDLDPVDGAPRTTRTPRRFRPRGVRVSQAGAGSGSRSWPAPPPSAPRSPRRRTRHASTSPAAIIPRLMYWAPVRPATRSS